MIKIAIDLKNMLRILHDDFDQKVKNTHDEMDLHHSYKKKACSCTLEKFLIRHKIRVESSQPAPDRPAGEIYDF